MTTIRRSASTPDLMSHPKSINVHEQQSQDTAGKSQRLRRCPGCHEPIKQHTWGLPGRHCQGPDDVDQEIEDDDVHQEGQSPLHGRSMTMTSPHVQFASFGHTGATAAADDGQSLIPDDSEKLDLERKLHQLELEERTLAELETLRAKVAAKEAVVSKIRTKQQQPKHPPTQQQQPQQQINPVASGLTSGLHVQNVDAAASLSSLLGSGPVGTTLPAHSGLPWQITPQVQNVNTAAATHSSQHQQVSLHDQFQARSDHHAEMFLAPAAVPLGEKVLRIVDFISSLVPKDTEQTISDMGGSRLLISYGHQRPRLESVSLTQWVVANTRIFHSLLFSSKLPTSRDVRDYLAYTVKIMELAGRYEWTSVLKFDDEFRQLQATYNFPWSHDSNHLHQVTLVPKAKPKPNTVGQAPQSNQSSTGPNTAMYSADNRIICRKFNSVGCQSNPCQFAHVWNRKVKVKACSSSHPATRHSAPAPQSG